MSKKHNTKHRRSRSCYPDRLVARGVSKRGVRMVDYYPFVAIHNDGVPGVRPSEAQRVAVGLRPSRADEGLGA